MAKQHQSQLIQLLDEYCTSDQIVSLLRPIKETHKDVHISGTKSDLLENLKRAMSEGWISKNVVYDLLRECEENGDQHIFYFRPQSAKAKALCNDGMLVAENIFGEDWGDTSDFPNLDELKEGSKWVDFRSGLGLKKKDWIGKIYTLELRDVHWEDKRDKGGNLTRYFKREKTRFVTVFRWNAPDLLELRISRTLNAGAKTMNERIQAAWEQVSPAFGPDDFVAWDIGPTRKEILKNRTANADDYRAGRIQLIDSHSGKIEIRPQTPEELGDGATETREALESLLAAEQVECPDVAITWLPANTKGILSKELATLIGGRYPNELLVQARASAAAIDYVTNQLRHFSQ